MKTPLCKICDQEGHYAYRCWKRLKHPIKPTKLLKGSGKYQRKWVQTRRKWKKLNPPDYRGMYTCYICGVGVLDSEVTLDHILPRSNRPDLRYELSNIAPACWKCNSQKGSKH